MPKSSAFPKTAPKGRLDAALTPSTIARLRDRAARRGRAGYRNANVTVSHLEQLLELAEKRAVRK